MEVEAGPPSITLLSGYCLLCLTLSSPILVHGCRFGEHWSRAGATPGTHSHTTGTLMSVRGGVRFGISVAGS